MLDNVMKYAAASLFVRFVMSTSQPKQSSGPHGTGLFSWGRAVPVPKKQRGNTKYDHDNAPEERKMFLFFVVHRHPPLLIRTLLSGSLNSLIEEVLRP